MKVCLYARVACHDQTALDCQVENLKAFAAEHSLDVVDVAAEFGSGMSADRQALSRVEALAVKRQIDAIIVKDISRLYRDTFKYDELKRRLDSYGVRIYTLDALQRLL